MCMSKIPYHLTYQESIIISDHRLKYLTIRHLQHLIKQLLVSIEHPKEVADLIYGVIEGCS